MIRVLLYLTKANKNRCFNALSRLFQEAKSVNTIEKMKAFLSKYDGEDGSVFLSVDSSVPHDEVDEAFGEASAFPSVINSGKAQRTTKDSSTFSDIDMNQVLIGNSPHFRRIRAIMGKVTEKPCNVFIYGETGCGKDVIAVELCKRMGKKPVSFTCGRMASELEEDYFFGHAEGAYTGAKGERKGILSSGKNSIIVFDDVQNISKSFQNKLQRILQTGMYNPSGSDRYMKTNEVMIFISNRPVDELIEEGVLNPDIAYRMAEERISVPSLREHREDIPLIVKSIEDRLGYKRHIEDFSLFMKHDYKGNVRELISIVKGHHRMSKDLRPDERLFNRYAIETPLREGKLLNFDQK